MFLDLKPSTCPNTACTSVLRIIVAMSHSCPHVARKYVVVARTGHSSIGLWLSGSRPICQKCATLRRAYCTRAGLEGGAAGGAAKDRAGAAAGVCGEAGAQRGPSGPRIRDRAAQDERRARLDLAGARLSLHQPPPPGHALPPAGAPQRCAGTL